MVITGEVIHVSPQVGVAYLVIRSKEVGTVKVRLTRDELSALAVSAVTALHQWTDSVIQFDGTSGSRRTTTTRA